MRYTVVSMRIARVWTNETCNQRCAYCNTRRPEERRDFVSTRSVTSRIESAVVDGVTEVVLTGGEPTLRRDLASLVVGLRARGVTRVALETNATTVDRARAMELATAGLSVARVQLPAVSDAYDAITDDPGSFARAVEGMRAFAAAGVTVEASIPVVRDNVAIVASLPAQIVSLDLPISALQFIVPIDAPDAATLASPLDVAVAIEAAQESARRVGLPARMESNSPLPPCLFEHPHRVAHLYTMSPGGPRRDGWTRLAACASCRVEDRCPGVPSAWIARFTDVGTRARPITEDRIRRRLSIISSVPEQIERELMTREVCRRPDGTSRPMHTVRVNFQCNQACHFCFVSTHLPAAEDARIREAIVEAGQAGGILALSGGEPTLNPKLAEFVRLGKSSGAAEIELQTNAVRLADRALTEQLVAAGVDTAFVSLHGSTAAISDGITQAPGTFEKTLRGLDEIARTPLSLRINFVFCEANREDFPRLVALVADRWPRAQLSVSFVAPSTDLVPRDRALVPRYSDVLPSMDAGIRLARSRGVGITGFESMCGLPLCLLPDGFDDHLGLPDVPDGLDAGEFVKTDACGRCAIASRCWGLRRGYLEMHGDSELRPVAEQANLIAT